LKPAYLKLLKREQLTQRSELLWARLASCTICPRHCQVNRLQEELGSCCIGTRARVSSYGPHLGEERPLRGWAGSGTIFFSGCNLHCLYCQNAEISQKPTGRVVGAGELAEIMLEIQEMGCHNINLVSPTHVVPQIVAAVEIAAGQGLILPLVYNTGGYDHPETIKQLEGIVDIYMPDMKYASAEAGEKYSDAAEYPFYNQRAVLEMHRQVGDLSLSPEGLAERGLLIRHLVLPGEKAGSNQILEFIASEISTDTYLNIMDQYRPAYQAGRFPELNRRINQQEYQQVVDKARALGFTRLDSW
jgi:putative pyruvate formate lyase activating enzyme